jgi:hypothetical protein
MMTDIAQQQLDESRRQYNDIAPYLQGIATTQQDLMQQNIEQGNDYYQNWRENYLPIEQSLVSDVAEYNTDAAKERMASEAGADVQKAATAENAATNRAMAAMGVNPNSGRYRALRGQNQLTTAARRAGAMTGARNRAEDIGYAKKLDVAGLGRGMTGASQGAYGTALGAGNSSGANYASPSNIILSGTNAAANSIGNAATINQYGANSILGSQSQQAASDYGMGDYLGTALAAWAGSGFAT